MADRLTPADGHVVLPMQRADIADHLGLTIETISRTVTQLAREHFIGLRSGSRDVDLCNIKGLRHLQG